MSGNRLKLPRTCEHWLGTANSSPDQLFEIDGIRIVLVVTERTTTLEAPTVVQTDRFKLIDSGLEPQRVDAVCARVFGKMIQDRFAQTLPAKPRPHVHTLHF